MDASEKKTGLFYALLQPGFCQCLWRRQGGAIAGVRSDGSGGPCFWRSTPGSGQAKFPISRVYTADFNGRTMTWEQLVLPWPTGRGCLKILVAAYPLTVSHKSGGAKAFSYDAFRRQIWYHIVADRGHAP